MKTYDLLGIQYLWCFELVHISVQSKRQYISSSFSVVQAWKCPAVTPTILYVKDVMLVQGPASHVGSVQLVAL